MSGQQTATSTTTANSARTAKPPPAPPVPQSLPPNPPKQLHPPPLPNGTHKPKKKPDAPVDPVTMYESLKSRIAALEEEEVLEEEEERRFAEEAQKSVKGMGENAIHSKYIELFAEFKRLERDHAKEKQKLSKDKDAAKSQLTKANQTKAKMENLARELQKDNKRLREDGKRLAQCVEEAQDELQQMRSDIAKRASKVQLLNDKYREKPDILVKVVCRYRAELFFKISRKTKLSKLFGAWTERMERTGHGVTGVVKKVEGNARPTTASVGSKVEPTTESTTPPSSYIIPAMQFVFTHNGRSVDADMTPEEAGIEDHDEILAVELMDLTESVGGDDPYDKVLEPRRQKLKKNWTDDPQAAKRSLEEIFDGVVRERLKEVLRQYELRERHFECVIRSKELEVLLSRARAAEQKQLANGEKARAHRLDEEIHQLRKEMEDAQNGQTMLIDKLIQCCKEPNAERTQRLFASLRDELEKRAPNLNSSASNNSTVTVNGKGSADGHVGS